MTDTDDDVVDAVILAPEWGREELIWLDIETTGLDDEWMAVLEIAVVVTGPAPKFARYDQFHRYVFPRRSDNVEVPRTRVWDQHLDSGLFDAARETGVPLSVALLHLEGWLTETHPEHLNGPMCGSSPHFDRRVLDGMTAAIASRHGTHFAGYMDRLWSYRNFDVSTLREAAVQMCGHDAVDAVLADQPDGFMHFAMPDLHRSIFLARSMLKLLANP